MPAHLIMMVAVGAGLIVVFPKSVAMRVRVIVAVMHMGMSMLDTRMRFIRARAATKGADGACDHQTQDRAVDEAASNHRHHYIGNRIRCRGGKPADALGFYAST